MLTTVGAVRADGKPFVIMEWDEKKGQLTPAQAIETGVQFLQAAIEAERDAGLLRWGYKAGLDTTAVAAILDGIRENREQIEMYAMHSKEAEAEREKQRKVREHDPRKKRDEDA